METFFLSFARFTLVYYFKTIHEENRRHFFFGKIKETFHVISIMIQRIVVIYETSKAINISYAT